MKKSPFWLIIAVLCAAPALASADVEYNFDKSTWPIPLVKRPIILAPGMLEVSGDTLIINASKDTFADPIVLAPDVYYGLSEKLMVGIDHQHGICLAGDACDNRYNDVAVNAVYSLMHGGNLDLAALLGAGANSIDPFAGGLNLGALAKVRLGSVAVLTGAQLYVGLFGRDEQGVQGKEYVRVPVQIQVQMQRQAAFLIDFAFNGPLDGFGDNLEIPIGAGLLYTLSNRLDVGAAFSFTDITVSGARLDNRAIYVRASLRL